MAEDTIEQTPFAPLSQIATIASTPQVGQTGAYDNPAVPGLGTPPPSTVQPFVPSQTQQGDYPYQKELDASSGGFLPNALAVAALLAGDFRPMMNLQEQKRKTVVAKFMEKPVVDINHMIRSGDFEGANLATDRLMSKVAPRVPELGSYLEKVRTDIKNKEADFENYKSFVTAQKEIIGEDNPLYPKLKAMDKLLQTHSPVNSQLLGIFAKQIEPNIHFQDGQMFLIDPTSGQMKATVLPTTFDKSMMTNTVMNTVSARTGITPDLIINMLRGQPIPGIGGQMVQPDPQTIEIVRNEIVKAQEQERQLEVGKNIPLSPDQAIQAQKLGLSPEQIAGRQFGPGEAAAMLHGDIQQRIKVAEAPVIAGILQDPTKMEREGIGVINMTPGPSFAQEQPLNTIKQVWDSGGNLAPVRRDVLDKYVTPSIKAINNIDYALEMFKQLGSTDGRTPLDTLHVTARRLIEDYTHIPLEPGDTAAKAAQAIADRAMNDLAGTSAIDVKEMAQLRKMVTGIAGNPEAAFHAIQLLKDKAMGDLSLYIDKNKIQANEALKKQVSGVTNDDWMPIAQKYGVNPLLAKAILTNEGSRDDQISPAGAVTRWQLMPATAKKYMDNDLKLPMAALTHPTTMRPVSNEVAMLHMAELQRQYPGNLMLQIAAYHGPKAIRPDGTINPTIGDGYKKTIDYVKQGMETVAKEQRQKRIYAPVMEGVQ